MATERSVIPEKQLLKLIEEQKGKNSNAVQAQVLKRRGMSFVSLGAWLGRFSFSKDWFRRRVDSLRGQSLDIKSINRILLLCACGFVLYFLASTTTALIQLNSPSDLEAPASENGASINLMERVFLKKAVSYYLEKMGQRDIFQMGAVQKVTTTDGVQTQMQVTSAKILEVTENLKLVGISWSSNPDAIIEDTKESKTFFVKPGQRIGEVKVQAIFKDKVILSYQGEETELK